MMPLTTYLISHPEDKLGPKTACKFLHTIYKADYITSDPSEEKYL